MSGWLKAKGMCNTVLCITREGRRDIYITWVSIIRQEREREGETVRESLWMQ